MSYQHVVELLGPVFWVVYACLLMREKSFPFFSMAFPGYVLVQFGLTVISAYIDVDKNMRGLLNKLNDQSAAKAANHKTFQTHYKKNTPEGVKDKSGVGDKKKDWELSLVVDRLSRKVRK